MKTSYLVKTLFTFSVPVAVSFPVQAFMPSWYPVPGEYHKKITLDALDQVYAAADSQPAQAASIEAMPASAPASPALQSSAVAPQDSSPFIPDSPEKQKRVKKLLNQIKATYGLRTGREFGSTSWGPRLGKLYILHKKLTNDDWRLLAEMYVTFHDSDIKLLAGIQDESNNNTKGSLRLDSAMVSLLAMHGKASIDTLTAMMTSFHWVPLRLQGTINMLQEVMDTKPWNDISEYKKDQQQSER